MAKKKKTVMQRVMDLEEREGILYGYIDDLRASTKRAEKRFEEFLTTNEKRMEQNEEGLREQRGIAHALTVLQGESLRLIKESGSRLNGFEDRLTQAKL